MKQIIKRTVIYTVARGFDLVDGEVVERSYQIPANLSSESRILRAVRRDHPQFLIVDWHHVQIEYELPLSVFLERATIVNTVEFNN